MNGILKCSGRGVVKNIGDYIQSVAQEQFWDHYDCFVERENMNAFVSEEVVNVIMNAWFMWHPENFPPSHFVNPLFISVHIVPQIAQRLLTSQNISYLKKYEPIGARDIGTRELLKSKGVESYFSGCLTLTLGEKYKSKERGKIIYFVDPFYEFGGSNEGNRILKHLRAWYYLLKYRKKIKTFSKKFVCEFPSFYRRFPLIEKKIMAASFYHAYSKLFSDELLADAVYLSHNVKQTDYPTDEKKMDYARELIRKYASAKLVVTSRIHCGLPCLGVETPVIFVTSEALNGDTIRSSGRFEGLIELFHVARWTENGVVAETEDLRGLTEKKKIETDVFFSNSDKYKVLRDNLIASVKKWQKECCEN